MEIEVSLPESLFPEGLELLIDGNLYTVNYTESIDDYPGRTKIFLKREKGE